MERTLQGSLGRAIWKHYGMYRNPVTVTGPEAEIEVRVWPRRRIHANSAILLLADGDIEDPKVIMEVGGKLDATFKAGDSLTLRFQHEDEPHGFGGVFLVFSWRFLGFAFGKVYRVLYFTSEQEPEPLEHRLQVKFI